MNLRVGDRVRLQGPPAAPKPEVTGLPHQIILEEGNEGEVVGFASGHPVVLWDAGPYRIFGGHTPGDVGKFLDRGILDCPAFRSGFNAERITPLSPSAAGRASTAEDELRKREQAQSARRREMVEFLGMRIEGGWLYSVDDQNKFAEVMIDHWDESDDAIARHLTAAGFNLDGRTDYVTRVKKIGDAKYRELLASKSIPATDKKWWQIWK